MHTLSKILTLLSSRGLNRYLTSFQSVDNLVGFFFGNEILLPTLALIEFDAVTYTTFCRFPFPFPFHPPNHMPCISLTIYRVAYICLYLSRVLRQQPWSLSCYAASGNQAASSFGAIPILPLPHPSSCRSYTLLLVVYGSLLSFLRPRLLSCITSTRIVLYILFLRTIRPSCGAR